MEVVSPIHFEILGVCVCMCYFNWSMALSSKSNRLLFPPSSVSGWRRNCNESEQEIQVDQTEKEKQDEGIEPTPLSAFVKGIFHMVEVISLKKKEHKHIHWTTSKALQHQPYLLADFLSKNFSQEVGGLIRVWRFYFSTFICRRNRRKESLLVLNFSYRISTIF